MARSTHVENVEELAAQLAEFQGDTPELHVYITDSRVANGERCELLITDCKMGSRGEIVLDTELMY